MIQVYAPGNTAYEKNGNYVLAPEECTLDMALNGSWEMEIVHPLSDAGMAIVEGAVIAAPVPGKEKQLFRVYQAVKSQGGITAYARPIFLDAAHDVFLIDVRPTEKSGQEALDILTNGTKYLGESDISDKATAYYQNKNLIEALASDDENSFLNRWGGEIDYDNYKIYINKRIGGDYGVTAEFGRNLRAIEESVDMSEVVTRIIPVAYNGYMLEGGSPWVDSPRINDYPIIYAAQVTYSDIKMAADAGEDEQGYDTLEELRAALKAAANADFAGGRDLPKIAYKVEMADLSQTLEYADVKILEEVRLGDTVHCKNKRLGINTDGRATRIVYDCILKKNVSVELGDYQGEYFSRLDDAVNTMGTVIDPGTKTVIAEKVAGTLNAIHTQLRYQKNIAQKQDVRAVLFEDIDPSSPTYGALCIGSQGFQIANRRTSDGRDWAWTTAFTADGGYADVIVSGLLADKTGATYWNLDTGEFYTRTGVFAGELRAATGTFAGELKAATGSFAGKITATSGYIGNGAAGWTIANSAIYNGCTSISDARAGTYVGINGIRNYASADSFTTITGGKITSNNVDLAGKITATSGYIGGNEITQEHLEVKARGGLIVANTANICMRDVQGELKAIIRPYTYDNNPNLAINAMGNILYLGAFDTPRGIYAMEGMFYDNGQTYISSDRRLKENVKEIGAEDSLAFLRKLHPVSFRYTGKPEVHHGLIAQEVREAIDGEWNVVTEYEHMEDRETGKSVTRLTLAYMEIIADLIGAIQAIDRRVEYLWKNH